MARPSSCTGWTVLELLACFRVAVWPWVCGCVGRAEGTTIMYAQTACCKRASGLQSPGPQTRGKRNEEN
eukprot:scaffold10285_cov53-Phaeocystis_antarctica.AAC.2